MHLKKSHTIGFFIKLLEWLQIIRLYWYASEIEKIWNQFCLWNTNNFMAKTNNLYPLRHVCKICRPVQQRCLEIGTIECVVPQRYSFFRQIISAAAIHLKRRTDWQAAMLVKYNLMFLIIPFVTLANGEDDEIALVNFCYNATYEGECNTCLT